MVSRDIRAVGLDLSLTGSGIADTVQVGQARVTSLRRVGQPGVTSMSTAEQIATIESLALQIVQRVLPDSEDAVWPSIAVIEALDNANRYGGSTERAVLWWKVVEALHLARVPVWMPTSSQVKIFATGRGLATKGEMIDAVTRLWPDWMHGGDDNYADAAAMAELGWVLAGHEPPVPLRADQIRVLPRIRKLTDPPARVAKRAAAKAAGKVTA